MSDRVQLVLGVLDRELIDARGVRCGRIDDLELDRDGRVVAFLCGPQAWRHRVPAFGRLLARLFGGGLVRVPWDEVESVEVTVNLRKPAPELGLDCGDERLRPLIARIPGASRSE